MELHKEVKQLLTLCAVCSPPDGTPAHFNIFFMFNGVFLTFILVSGMLSSIVVIVRSDFTTAINFAGDLIALIGSVCTMLTGFFFREKTKELFAKLQQNYEQFESDESIKYSNRADRISQKVAVILAKYLVVGIKIFYLAISIWSLASNLYQDGLNFQVENLYHPYLFPVPWDVNSFFGWIGYNTFFTLLDAWYFFVCYVYLALFLAICMDFYAFRKQFESILAKLNAEATAKHSNVIVINERICELIKHHVFMKDIFVESASFFRRFLFLTLLCNVGLMTIKVFLLDQNFEEADATNFTDITACLIILYVYCFLGASVTEHCLKLCDILYASEWYHLPSAQLKFYILMMASIQRPLAFDGFYVIYLNLETFKKMMNTFVSYFLALRTLAE